MVGRLYGMSRAAAKRRAGELLERFDLSGAASRVVKGYSGGMRRRLDLAAALVAEPPILFLDEPTTGLDPRSRLQLWETIEELASEGTTVMLTTQYLDEADRLASAIAVIDHGRVIAARQLRRAQGPRRRESAWRSTCSDADRTGVAAEVLSVMGDEAPSVDGELVCVSVRHRPRGDRGGGPAARRGRGGGPGHRPAPAHARRRVPGADRAGHRRGRRRRGVAGMRRLRGRHARDRRT